MEASDFTIDQQIAHEIRAKTICDIVNDRNEKTLLEYCSRLETDSTVISSMLGVLRAYYKHDKDSFEWAMYVLSLHKGYEEILASFFIATYQLNNKKEE